VRELSQQRARYRAQFISQGYVSQHTRPSWQPIELVIVMANDGGEEILLPRRSSYNFAHSVVAAGAGPVIRQLAHQAAPIAACRVDLLVRRYGQRTRDSR
jgi:hypothetical protein